MNSSFQKVVNQCSNVSSGAVCKIHQMGFPFGNISFLSQLLFQISLYLITVSAQTVIWWDQSNVTHTVLSQRTEFFTIEFQASGSLEITPWTWPPTYYSSFILLFFSFPPHFLRSHCIFLLVLIPKTTMLQGLKLRHGIQEFLLKTILAPGYLLWSELSPEPSVLSPHHLPLYGFSSGDWTCQWCPQVRNPCCHDSIKDWSSALWCRLSTIAASQAHLNSL